MTVVADRADPIRLYPAGSIEPGSDEAQIDASHPERADYVVIPAMEPRDDPADHRLRSRPTWKGAKIVSILQRSLTMSATGIARGAQGHRPLVSIKQLQTETRRWKTVPDRAMWSIGTSRHRPDDLLGSPDDWRWSSGQRPRRGREAAMAPGSRRLGRSPPSSFFQLNARPQDLRSQQAELLAARNHRHQGRPNVHEMALGFMVDAYSRPELSRLSLIGETDGLLQTRHGPAAPAGRNH